MEWLAAERREGHEGIKCLVGIGRLIDVSSSVKTKTATKYPKILDGGATDAKLVVGSYK
jgi:hypothetical protein